MRRLNDTASSGLRPDLTLLLDCPAAVGLRRTARRLEQTQGSRPPEDRFEREESAFHERVRNGFLELAHAGSSLEGKKLADLQKRIDSKGLLFKVRVMSAPADGVELPRSNYNADSL